MIETSDSFEAAGTNDKVRDRMQEIARAEIQRQRSRMDSFTPEQVSAVEALLLATANEISAKVTERIQRYPAEVRARYLQVWTVQAA